MAELANPRRRLVLSTFAAAKSPIRILGVSERQLGEMGDEFEDVEHQTFGKDGFEDAVKQIAEIEQTLGFADLAQVTAPPPAKA